MQPRGTVITVAMDMERSDNVKYSLTDLHTLTFEKPDMNTFTCLATCISAIKKGGLYPTAANGANEKAVELFLKGKISFLEIGEFVNRATEDCQNKEAFTLEDVFETDKLAREAVLSYIK